MNQQSTAAVCVLFCVVSHAEFNLTSFDYWWLNKKNKHFLTKQNSQKYITISLLTVFSRVSNHYFRLWAAAIIVQSLNLDLVGHVRWSSRDNKLGNVGHSLWGPILIHVLLSPLHFVLQTGPISQKSCQWLYREFIYFCQLLEKKPLNIFYLNFGEMFDKPLLAYCPQ